MPEQPPAGPEQQPARFPWLSLTVVAVMAALLIALAEISRLGRAKKFRSLTLGLDGNNPRFSWRPSAPC